MILQYIVLLLPATGFLWSLFFEGRMTIVITIVVPHCVGSGHGKHDPRQKLHITLSSVTLYHVDINLVETIVGGRIYLLINETTWVTRSM